MSDPLYILKSLDQTDDEEIDENNEEMKQIQNTWCICKWDTFK